MWSDFLILLIQTKEGSREIILFKNHSSGTESIPVYFA